MYIIDRILLIYKNFLRSIAYFGKTGILFRARILPWCLNGIRLHNIFFYNTSIEASFFHESPVMPLKFFLVLPIGNLNKVLI